MENANHSSAAPSPQDDAPPLPFAAMMQQPGATYYMPLDLSYEEKIEANALLEPPENRPYEKVVRLDNGLLRSSIHRGDDEAADDETDDAVEDQVKGHWNEDAVARRMVVRHGDELRYCHAARAWFVWDGAVWRRDLTGHVLGLIRAAVRDGLGGLRENSCLLAPSARFCAGVERFVRDEPAFAAPSAGRDQDMRWDADPWRLGTPGGIVDLTTGVLHPADPADHITRATAVAPAESSDCPVWRRFLDEAMGGDQTLIAFLQRFLGYALTGQTCEHTLLFGLGEGGNGKSVFVNTLRGIFGDYAAVAAPDLLAQGAERRAGKAHSTEIAMLDGARLVTASETEEGRVWADGRLKLLTGGDPVTARFLGRDHFTFTPRFKLITVGNHMPVLRTVDAAIRRRLCVVPFATQPATPDRKLEAKLKDE